MFKQKTKQSLYESIMRDISKIVKKSILESYSNLKVDYKEFGKLINAIQKYDIAIAVEANLFLSGSKNVGYMICFEPTEKTRVDEYSIKNISINFVSLCDTDNYGRRINEYPMKDKKDEYVDVVFDVSGKDVVACKAYDVNHSSYTPEILFTNSNAIKLFGPDRNKVDVKDFKLFKK